MTFARGSLAWGECAICAGRYYLHELREDGWRKGLLTCPNCWDAPQKQEEVPDMDDPIALEKPSPERFAGTVVITLPTYVLSLNILSGQNEIVARGTFDFGVDTFKLALYTAAPAASYSATNEVVGSGYTATGVSVTATHTNPNVTFTDGTLGTSNLTFTHGLVYRVSDGLGLADINFGATYRTRNQSLRIEFPDDFALLVGSCYLLEPIEDTCLLQEDGFLILQES